MKKLNPEEREMVTRLEKLPDNQIDTADIPEAPPQNWRLAQRGSRKA